MGNSVGGYICQCLHGFQGTNCQQGNLLVILIVYFTGYMMGNSYFILLVDN